MKIGDLFLALGVDSADFTTTVKKEAEAAGKEGGLTMSKAIGASLKVGAVAIGAGLAIATKGALEAEAAQGKFMAATGKSREEAKKFVSSMDSLAGSAGTVGMRFEDIAALGTMVEQQFGTTGDETRALTENIAEFAKVTGQDATGAAADLEDTLSSYGLSAEDAAGFMDELVASNQKFGTDVGPAALQTLRDFAPALQAAGMGLDDGVELLNAFEVAGLDAGAASKGLTKALGELKPGQTIDDLIAQVGAIEDPLLRAQAAADLFGTKAGPKLAAVIKPGMTSLDDFGVSAEEASGKTQQAAEDMLTFGDRIRGFADKALAGAREIGQDFGPAITGLASLGSLAAPLITKLGPVISEVGGKLLEKATELGAKVLPELFGVGAEVAGEAIGESLGEVGKKIGAGIAEEAAPEFVETFGTETAAKLGAEVATGQLGGATENAGKSLGSRFGGAMALGVIAALPLIAIAIIKWADDNFGKKGSDYQTVLATSAQESGKVWADALTAAIESDPEAFGIATEKAGDEMVQRFLEYGQKSGEAAGQGLHQSQAQLADDARETVRFANQAMITEAENARKVGHALAEGLLDSLPNVHDAWKQYVTEMKNALDPQKELAWLEGKLASKKLQEGLASNNPLVRAQAEDMRDQIQGNIDDLKGLLAQDGKDASAALGNNLDGSAAVAAAAEIARKVNAQLDKIDTSRQIYINRVTGKGDVQAGARAEGGFTPAGWSGWIGERGKEWWQAAGPGYVVPNDRLGSVAGQGAGNSFDVTVNIAGNADADAVRIGVRDGILEATGLHFDLRHAGGLAFKGSPS